MAEELRPVGGAEAAAILEVEATRIARYRREGRMPPTVADLAATPVWDAADIEAMRDNDDRYPEGRKSFGRRKLAGTSEAAERFGVSKRAIARWREQGIFPDPAYDLAAGPVWTGAQLGRFTPPSARRARAAA